MINKINDTSEEIADLKENGGTVTNEQISQILDEVGSFIMTTGEVVRDYVPTNLTQGYMSKTGTAVPDANTNLGYTEKIPVEAGQVIKARYIYAPTGKPIYQAIRFVTAFVNGVAVSSLGDENITPEEGGYVVPDTVTEVVVTGYFFKQTQYIDGLIEITGMSNNVEGEFYLKQNPIPCFQVEGDMVDGTVLTLPENNVKNKTITSFFCNVGTLNKLYIGKKGSSEKPYICIDNTNVLWCTDTGATYTKAHGLTIKDYLGVRIETETGTSATKIVLTTNGASVDLVGDLKCAIRWIADIGSTFARSEGSTLTNCTLSFMSKNMDKPIWAFGDSYFSFYQQRWVYYMCQDGYDKNVLLNGFAGENSQQALVGLKNLLEVGRPRYIFWCLGMNDGDSSSAVDGDWLDAYEEMCSICDGMGIELILATIPQTPTINHSFKNAIIRESGRRYVDFEKAVVSDVSNGTWYTGMLSSDNVHPENAGAIALYHRVLADFPEIMVDGNLFTGSSAGESVDIDAIVQDVIDNLLTEDWTFTLEDGSTVTKKVVLV